LLSGVIVVKVVIKDGPRSNALVIFDVRRGWRRRQLVHSHDSDGDDDGILACIDTPKPGTKEDAPLVRVRLSWNKYMGIYNDMEREFR
jgi:hypothetical protein